MYDSSTYMITCKFLYNKRKFSGGRGRNDTPEEHDFESRDRGIGKSLNDQLSPFKRWDKVPVPSSRSIKKKRFTFMPKGKSLFY